MLCKYLILMASGVATLAPTASLIASPGPQTELSAPLACSEDEISKISDELGSLFLDSHLHFENEEPKVHIQFLFPVIVAAIAMESFYGGATPCHRFVIEEASLRLNSLYLEKTEGCPFWAQIKEEMATIEELGVESYLSNALAILKAHVNTLKALDAQNK